MTIAIFAGYFAPRKGGYEMYVFELARRLVQRRHRVIVVTVNDDRQLPPRQTVAGIIVLRLPSWAMLKGTYHVLKPSTMLLTLSAQLKAYRVDLIHTHTRFFLTSLLGAIMAKQLRVPHIHTEHGSSPVPHAPFVQLAAWFYDQTFGRLTVSLANVVVPLSRQGERFVRGLGAKRTVIIPNGVDTEFFHPRLLEDPEPLVIFVGRLIRMKGVQDLLAVWPEVGEGKTFLIVGEGPYRPLLQRQAASLSGVAFAGEMEREDVRRLLSKAALLVNPSYAEGVPTSVLEAVSMGVPVVATDVGGTSEIAAYANNIFLYRAGDLKQLTEAISKALASGRRQPSSAFRQRFSWGRIVDQYEQLFHAYTT